MKRTATLLGWPLAALILFGSLAAPVLLWVPVSPAQNPPASGAVKTPASPARSLRGDHAVKARVEGPANANPGDLVVLDASGSVGATRYAWLLAGSDKTFLPVDGGRRVVFASGTQGAYTFVLSVAGLDDEGKADLAMVRHVLTIGKPSPGPNPPPGPDPEPEPQPPPGPVDTAAAKVAAGLKGFPMQAHALGDFYVAFAKSVESATILRTVGQFATAHNSALRQFVASTDYKGAPLIGANIDAYLAAAMGLTPPPGGGYPDAALDAATKVKLVKGLADLAAALKAVQ